jgi:hypothetical protein
MTGRTSYPLANAGDRIDRIGIVSRESFRCFRSMYQVPLLPIVC